MKLNKFPWGFGGQSWFVRKRGEAGQPGLVRLGRDAFHFLFLEAPDSSLSSSVLLFSCEDLKRSNPHLHPGRHFRLAFVFIGLEDDRS